MDARRIGAVVAFGRAHQERIEVARRDAALDQLARSRQVRVDQAIHRLGVARAIDRGAVDERGRRAVDPERLGRRRLGDDRVVVAAVVERGAERRQVEAGRPGEPLEVGAREVASAREHLIVERPELALLGSRHRGLGGERGVAMKPHRQVAIDDAHVVAVLLAQVGQHRRLLGAERALEVAPFDDRDQRVVGAALVTRQAEPDPVQRHPLELARLVRRIGGELAARHQRVVAGVLLAPARQLLIDELDEDLERQVALHRPAVDEERRRPGDPERPGGSHVRLDRRSVRAGIEIRAKPHHVEAELARDQLDGRAIDVATERVQPIVHRQEPALGPRRERGLGPQRVVVIERQRAVDPAQLARVQPREVIERALHAVAVAARVVAPRDDRDRRADRAVRRCVAARDLVDGRRIEAQAIGAGGRARDRAADRDDRGDREDRGQDNHRGGAAHHAEPSSSAASSRPRGPVPRASRVRPPPGMCASSICR